MEHEFLQRLVFPDLTQVIDKTLQLTFISGAKVAVYVKKTSLWKLEVTSFFPSWIPKLICFIICFLSQDKRIEKRPISVMVLVDRRIYAQVYFDPDA